MVSQMLKMEEGRTGGAAWLRSNGLLLPILLLALLLRVGYIDIIGHSDINYFYNRAAAIDQHGLLAIYAQDEGRDFNYPPLYFAMQGIADLWWSPVEGGSAASNLDFLRWHKLLQIAADLVLIAAVYLSIPRAHKVTRWLVPLLLAVCPGVILTSAFWGQTDSLWTLFAVLALIAFQHERPRLSWVLFILSLLTKFQAVFLTPLLLILTFRRFGLRTTLTSVVVAGVVFSVALLPFAVVSGFDRVLRPFTVAVDFFPSTTVWALNLWYAIIPFVWAAHPALVYENIPDTNQLFNLLSYKLVGLLLLATYVLSLSVAVWKQRAVGRVWVWAAALSFAFFILPTQMHERYFYPAVIFLALAVVQDWRLWPAALGVLFTYSYNVIVPTHAPFTWLGINLLFTLGDITLSVALLNTLLFIYVTWVAFTPTATAGFRAYLRTSRPLARVALGLVTVCAVILLATMLVPIIVRPALPPAVQPLDARFDDALRLEGYHLTQDGSTLNVTLYWRAEQHDNHDFTIFVHAARTGATIAQHDEKPEGGSYPVYRWFRNRLVVTHIVLNLPDGVLPDTLYAGLYDDQLVNAGLVQNGQPVPDGRALLCTNGCAVDE